MKTMKARGSLFIIIMCIAIILFPGCGKSTYSQFIYVYDTNTWERKTVSLCEGGEYIVELAAGENSIYCLMSDREGTMHIGKANLSEDSITSIIHPVRNTAVCKQVFTADFSPICTWLVNALIS